jgi:hypothetical protein
MLANNALERSCAHRGRAVLARDGALAGAEWARAWPLNSVVMQHAGRVGRQRLRGDAT